MKLLPLTLLYLIIFAISCKSDKSEFDASGIFEADEVIISSEVNGKIIQSVDEGSEVKKGQDLVTIENTTLLLQKQQVEASMGALSQKKVISKPQNDLLRKQKNAQEQNLLIIKEQLRVASIEQKRIRNLVAKDAAPAKQQDDIDGQISILNQQIRASEAQLSNFDQQVLSNEENSTNQNNGILSERKPLEVRIAQINDQISRAKIIAPIDGNILVKYMKNEEIATIGKPIMKVAKNNTMILRAYVTSSQLATIKLHQKVTVFIGKEKNQKTYTGDIIWISPKSEFTPKTIQTVDERENLVYALKVNIPNDGYLKIGMYGDIKFK